MLPVVSLLYRSPSFCLRDCFFHGFCHIICIHDHMAFAVSCCTADSLYQGCFRTEEALFASASRIATSVISGISSPSRRRLIPTSTSNTSSRISRMISARSRVSISEWRYRTRIPQILHIIGKVLCHTFGQGRDQDFIFLFNFLLLLLQDHRSVLRSTHLHLRIKKP